MTEPPLTIEWVLARIRCPSNCCLYPATTSRSTSSRGVYGVFRSSSHWRWRGLHPGLKEVPHAHYTMCPPLDYRDRGRPGKQRGMHNAGGGNHVARLVLLELMSENGLSAGDIAEIQAEVVPRRDEGLTSSVHHANTSLSHSGREVLALAALHGGEGLREAHDEKFSNTPEFSGMLERVKLFTLEPRYLSYSRAWAHSLTGACSTAASARNNLTIPSANRL